MLRTVTNEQKACFVHLWTIIEAVSVLYLLQAPVTEVS